MVLQKILFWRWSLVIESVDAQMSINNEDMSQVVIAWKNLPRNGLSKWKPPISGKSNIGMCRTKVQKCISSWVGWLFTAWCVCVFCVQPLTVGPYQYVRFKKGKLAPVYTMKPYMGNRGKFHSFLTLTLSRGQPLYLCIKNPWYSLSRRLGGFQHWSGHVGEQKNP
jgi:hypothetical protein